MVEDARSDERLLIVSADGHAAARVETYRDYIDPEFRSALDDLAVECAEWNRLTKHEEEARDDEFPGWNLSGRLRALDAEGVVMEVVHPGVQGTVLPFFAGANQPRSPELQTAGCRAYNRWLADWIADSGGRILGVAQSTCFDIEATVRELEWAAQRGFVAAMLPQTTYHPELPPLHDRYYDPFWAACEDLGLRLALHAGWGIEQGRFWEFSVAFLKQVLGRDEDDLTPGGSEDVASLVKEALLNSKESPLVLSMAPRRALWQLMIGGVLDRHPSLVIVVTELRADWLPATLAALDERCRQVATWMELLPSEYWVRNCFVTPSSIRPSEVEMRHEIGLDRMLLGTDCPHPEATYPQTRDWLRLAFRGVALEEVKPVLADNAIRCYGLDRARVERLAAKIGPRARDIFDDADVDGELVADFHRRAGLLHLPEKVDSSAVWELLDLDLAAVSARLP